MHCSLLTVHWRRIKSINLLNNKSRITLQLLESKENIFNFMRIGHSFRKKNQQTYLPDSFFDQGGILGAGHLKA
jgi:hypothetical protein